MIRSVRLSVPTHTQPIAPLLVGVIVARNGEKVRIAKRGLSETDQLGDGTVGRSGSPYLPDVYSSIFLWILRCLSDRCLSTTPGQTYCVKLIG